MKETLKRAFIPSLGDFIYVFVFLFLLRMLPHLLYGDGGTGWHLATGRFIAETGKIPYNDFMSFTFAGDPWVSQYWLFDIIMYWFQKALGYNGLAVFLQPVSVAYSSGCTKFAAERVPTACSYLHWYSWRPFVLQFNFLPGQSLLPGLWFFSSA